MMSSQGFSHLDADGNARMVDVGEKAVTRRVAIAQACVRLNASLAGELRSGGLPKGDVLQVARIAAIGAAKRTDELIPCAIACRWITSKCSSVGPSQPAC